MSTAQHSTVRLFRAFAAASIGLLGIGNEALAVAPATPVITRVDFSRAGFLSDASGVLYDANGVPRVDVSGNRNSYVVRWQDKSVDEEGFRVELKGAVTGTILYAANTQEALISPIQVLEKDKVIEFTVTAWKYNGTRIETSTSTAFKFTMPELTGAGSLATPTSLTATNINDSTIKLAWNDTSTAELYYQLLYREVQTPALGYSHLGFTNFFSAAPTDQTMRLRLIPNTDYHFQVRATQQAPSGSNPLVTLASGLSPQITLRTLPLGAPTELRAEALKENTVLLQWNDNSTNETGYEIQYRLTSESGTAGFTTLGNVGENSRSATVPVPQGSSIEWQVLALYSYTPSGATTATVIKSTPSNAAILSTTFPAPSGLVAVTSPGVANTIDLSWEDNSDSEYGFNIYTRPTGTSTYYFARAVRAGVTKVSVNSRTESNDSNGLPIFTTLASGVTHEFVVRAVASNETTVSVDSNMSSAVAKDGFTSRLYQPAQKGVSFSYQVTTSNAANRSSWNVTGLPTGLTFNSSTGQITGTPSVAGIFEPTMTASFTGGAPATATLILRVLRSLADPVITTPISNLTVGINLPFTIPLSDKFSDPDSEIAVRLETSKGTITNKNIDILLYPSLAPLAVSNFLSYVNAGDFNGIAFHRLVQGFVLQAGSLKPIKSPRSFVSVPGRPSVINEPGITHVRGTIAAAKIGARNSIATLVNGNQVARDDSFGYVGDPDSATTDFFFNLANNASNLDNQNGGFTAFGRVTNAGMLVVDDIAALPPGDYLNNNTGNSYSASLDKRIFVDGSSTPWSDIPMDADSAPADMDINKTVRIIKASIIPTLNYTIQNTYDTSVITPTLVGNELKITGKAVGSTNLTIIVADLDNRQTSRTFAVTVSKGHLAPKITRQPVAQAVVAGTKATLSVTATGTALTYRWRKNGTEIDGQTGAGSASLVFTSVQPTDAGLYDVIVSNATTTLTSTTARLDIRSAPAITLPLMPLLVEVGKPLVLTTAATGAPAPTFAWKRGVAGVAGQTTSKLSIAATKLTDAGVYSVTATNLVNKATSNSVNVIAVDKRATSKVIALNGLVTLIAPVSGPEITYRWKKNNTAIPLDTTRHSGFELSTLKITAAQAIDSGAYTCLIGLPNGLGTVETGAINLAIVNRPVLPALSGAKTAPNGFIGVDYRWELPYSKFTVDTPTSFVVTGLPPGLVYSTTTGIISGRPTKAGIYPIAAVAKNPAGSSTPTSTGDLTILPLPLATIGSLSATVGADAQLNGGKGGRLDLTVLDTGTYTAKLVLGKETINTTGNLGVGTGLFDATSLTYQSRITIVRKTPPNLTVTFEIDADAGYVSGVLSNGTNSVAINGVRQFWDGTWNPCPYGAFAGNRSYNVGLHLAESDVGKAAVPQGSGYLNMLISYKGTATISGRMPDGTTITGSSIVGIGGETLLFQMLYLNTGSVLGSFDIGSKTLVSSDGKNYLRVSGEARWIKDVQPATQRTYQAGIPETILSAVGTNYQAPSPTKIVMNLPNQADNAQLDFSEGGLSTAAPNPDLTLRLTTVNTPAYPTTNPAKVSLAVTASTGSFTGAYTLSDGRRVVYQGLIIPNLPQTPEVTQLDSEGNTVVVQNEIPASTAQGAGYFLLPELLPSLTKSKINAGRVVLQPAQISITTQPLSQAVNPGATVTFSVVATGQSTLTYRWRKNGTTISGATGTSYSPPPVTEASQGNYDCVISNGSSTVTTAVAVLNVNDPVTNVSFTRNLTGSVISSGVSLSMTATAQGTGPLTYQWQKDSVDIPGATSASYVINPTTLGDSGSYRVIVKNILSTSGVTSSASSFTVANPVTINSVSRTPADEPLTAGTSVTFNVDATGTGTLTYQWRKAGIDIPGATASSYTIPTTSTGDSGSYTVIVKNVVSTSNTPSSAVLLTVVAP